MPTQRLLLDCTDNEHFFLSLKDGTLSVGGTVDEPDIALGNLKVVKFVCMVELDGQPITVASASNGSGLQPGAELQPNQSLELGHFRLDLQPGDDDPSAAQTEAPGELKKRLVVVDGADHGKAFALKHDGKTTIGNNSKFADIVLHDLYVSRLHCELQVDGDHVLVTHIAGKGGTLINGKEIAQAVLQLGDILRIGNSHLRYDVGVVDPVELTEAASEPKLPALAPSKGSDSANGLQFQSGGSTETADPLLGLEGTTLGHYQIETLLGRGRSGVVYRAQAHKTGHTVSLKVLAPEFPADEMELQRFIKVIKLVAPLRHAHLVSLFAAGKTGAFCWIAREHVEGESLAQVIERLVKDGKFSWKRACRVAVHLGKVLDFLQQHQTVHGNLTPANVLVESAGKATKLADLLLEKALAGSRLADSIHESKRISDLPYFAPEQLGSEAPVDACANMFSVGAIVYTLLLGRPPFKGTSAAEILRDMKETKLVKPSHYVRETPAPFEAAILKMLAWDREDRYQNAADLLAAVEPIANMHEIG